MKINKIIAGALSLSLLSVPATKLYTDTVASAEDLSLTNDNLSLTNNNLSLTNNNLSLTNNNLSLTNDNISLINNNLSNLNNEDTYFTTVDDIVYKIYTSYLVSTVIPPHAEVYKYEGSSSSITLPESIDGYPLLSVGKAFKNNTDIVSVVLSPSIQFIDTEAFMGCTHLNEIVFTTSDEDYWVEIGPYDFKN